jgi:SAM-dependent methyltransferase
MKARPEGVTKAGPRENYSQQDHPAFEEWMAKRTAAHEAAFFLPHLRPGMRVLDVGCGPGSLTLGLAEVAAPGVVIGIDRQPSQIKRAYSLALERKKTNMRFGIADCYKLPFRPRSFEAVFAHGVLMHLSEPANALREMRRVLIPGGIAAVRDPDFGATLISPTTPLLEQWAELRIRVRQHNGSDPFIGRHHRRLLLEAGFVHPEASAEVDRAGSLNEARRAAAWFKVQLQGLARTALAQGWVNQATVDAMATEIDAWAERPEAFFAGIWCSALGWAGK